MKDVISVDGYRAMTTANAVKDVLLPSGATFKIKKVSGKELIRQNISLPLKNTRAIAQAGSKDNVGEVIATLDDEGIKKIVGFMDNLIVMSVITPEISLKTNEVGKLYVGEIADDDYDKLATEVKAFSLGGVADKLRPFRDGKAPVANGQDSAEIQRPAVNDTGKTN